MCLTGPGITLGWVMLRLCCLEAGRSLAAESEARKSASDREFDSFLRFCWFRRRWQVQQVEPAMEYCDHWRFASLTMVLLMSCCRCAQAAQSCPQAIFAFGASMSDTGNSAAAFPYQSPMQFSPYGESFFRRPANRWSDGRVLVDFFAQALKIPLLSPQLQAVGYDFAHGVNFAFAGVITQNNSYSAALSPPFYFWIQTKQFQYFKERTLALWKEASKGGVLRSSLKLSTKPKYFQSGLYFTTFGTNDFVVSLLRLGQTIEQVQSNISSISNAMVANTEELYKQGARTLMVFNVPPLGCYPIFLVSPQLRNMSTVDTHGCLAAVNAAVEGTNSLIRSGLQGLRVKYADATIIYADLYRVLQTLIWNSTAYGFTEAFKVCCGVGGGEYNLQQGLACGASVFVNGELMQGKSCSNPGSHIFWDGLHITEAAARFVALTFLRGEHLEPSYNLAKLCKLSYEQFY